jgi:hypothetical protein
MNVMSCAISCLEIAPDRLLSVKCLASEPRKSPTSSPKSKCVLEVGSDAVQDDRWFTLVGATFKKTHMVDAVSGIDLTSATMRNAIDVKTQW